MMWLPVVITLVVVIIIAAAYVSQSRKDSEPASLFLLVASTVYITGLSMGFFVTHFASPTLETWRWAIGVRATWQLAGTVLILVCIGRLAIQSRRSRKRSLRAFMGVATALGLAAASNPVRDLVSGPEVLHVTDFEKKVLHSSHWGRGSSDGIFVTLKVNTPGGQPRQLDLTGWGANTAEDLLDACDSPVGTTVTVLAHVERVLEVRCP